MKAIIKLVQIILILFLVNSSLLAAGIMDAFEAKKVAPHTLVVMGPTSMPNPENKGFMNNPAFIITEKSVVVIDPGSSVQVGKALLEKIRQKTNKPVTHVFDSHVHGDHWLGNQAIKAAFPEVKIYAHPVMIEEAKAGAAESWIELMKTLTAGATAGTQAVIPDQALQDGQEIKVDDITIKSHLSEKAHTKTDAMFEIIEDKVLITGDNAFNQRMPRLDDGSFLGNMQAMDKGLSLDVDVVIPGHGPVADKVILRDFREFLYTIYDTSKKLLDEDLEAFEMKPVIINKLQKYHDWENFEGAIGKLISIAVLEAEDE
ncbi:MAG TPA: MBL fold metallo-hydrolase [Oceanospirillales bacterium]|nr:MBL fold metallo-hydrolase [Oceanospirillales bacterium]